MKMKLPAHSFHWSTNSHTENCLAFCYPRIGHPYILKGSFQFVDAFLTNINQPIIVHYALYGMPNHGKNKKRVIVYGMKEGYKVSISHPRRSHPITGGIESHQRCWISVINSDGVLDYLKAVRAVPRKWIKELNTFVNPKANNYTPFPIFPCDPFPSKSLHWLIIKQKNFKKDKESNSNPENFKKDKDHFVTPVTPVTLVTPVTPVLTAEEKKEKESMNEDRLVMASLLKKVGAWPTDHRVNIFEIDEIAMAQLQDTTK